jgi:hypothetical protein
MVRWGACVVAIVTCLVTSLSAEVFQIAVPGANLVVTFEAPPIGQFQGERMKDRFRFMAGDTDQRVVVTLFMEPWKAGRDASACRTEYWSQGSKNPAIVKGSASQVDVAGRPAVSYVLEGEGRSGRVRSQNVNVYVVHGESCFDFHVSRTGGDDKSNQDVMAIAESLRIERPQSK